MRWLVEVTQVGKSEAESLQVEAESWQRALQAARSQRGESAPMAGFSIELLDDGCRAVDPSSRVRYEVRKAPILAPPRPNPSSRPPPGLSSSPSRRPPLSAAAMATVIGPPSPAATRAAPPLSEGTTSSPPPSARTDGDGAGAPASSGSPASDANAAAAVGARPSAPPPSLRVDPSSVVPSQVVFKREHDATEAIPLTYREYVFLVPAGTTELQGESLLQTQIDLVRASLARVPPGQLVNLAVLDAPFHGKPPVPPPLVTLTWKDWRGAPVVVFPRRSGADAEPHPVSVRPSVPPAAPRPAPVVEAAPSTDASTPLTRSVPPPSATPPAASSRPPPSEGTASRPRARSEDLIADLFEAMHQLHFLRDAVEGGDFCLNLALEKMPSQAAIVHLYDIDRREFLVTSTRGDATGKLLLRRHGETDPILSTAMRRRHALVVADATASEAGTLDRYTAVGGARSLVVAPVMQAGRFLGAIELINPLDGQPFTDAEGHAVSYIAEQFAEFVATRGVVTDPARIGSPPASR